MGGRISYIYLKDGNLIHGLYLEGCRWDFGKEMLIESDPKVLFTLAPIIWLKPTQFDMHVNEE
jgi:dynein heavy chain